MKLVCLMQHGASPLSCLESSVGWQRNGNYRDPVPLPFKRF